MLNEEKGKTHKASQMLTNANKTIGDLKRKISKMEKEQSDLALSHEDHDAKLFKYREIVRKKDELLTRNQQKVD